MRQKQPNEAAKEILDFVKVVAAHGVCYGLIIKKPMQYHKDWFYFATLPPIETCKKESQLNKAKGH